MSSESTMKHLSSAKKLLGVDYTEASQKIHKLYLFDLLKQYNKNFCYRCACEIKEAEDLSLDHIEDWRPTETREFRPDLFLEYNNIAYSHRKCNYAASNSGTGLSKYVGVCIHIDKRKGYQWWKATIKLDGKLTYLGYYKTEMEAAEARDLGVIRYLDGVGLLNFPDRKEEFKKRIENGWERPKKGGKKCKICGDKHFAHGYCSVHNYRLNGGIEKRKKKYKENGY